MEVATPEAARMPPSLTRGVKERWWPVGKLPPSVPVTAIINENVSVSETFDISNGDYYKVVQWKDVDSITPVRAAQRFNK